MVNPKLRGDARSASDVGCAALRAGRRDEAVRWLDRAHRMAPDDVSTKFLLASALVGVDDQAGVALLLALAADYPEFRDAQVALVAAEHRAGEPMAAAQRLGALLARTAPPPGEAFVRLADAVARAAGAPGWIAANSAGQVLCSAAGGTLALRLDDVKLPARRGAIRQLPPRWRDARFLSAVSAEGLPKSRPTGIWTGSPGCPATPTPCRN
jgi:hypothetical protein